MKFLQKIWVRLLISFFLGGVFSEVIHLTTGINSTSLSNLIVFSVGIFSFIIVTLIVSIHARQNKKPFGERIKQDSSVKKDK